MAILVCGGAGYIGSHINKQLYLEGYDTIVFDNLVYGHREAVKWGELIVGDLANIEDLEAVFTPSMPSSILLLMLMWVNRCRSRRSITTTMW